ncbi:MAG TPA: helix-turn-helix transcriptional regulator [Nevskiaceae bacterium]|nr:helix-turn-helix transcriptional regulator [Nevskiaceae bacterium]
MNAVTSIVRADELPAEGFKVALPHSALHAPWDSGMHTRRTRTGALVVMEKDPTVTTVRLATRAEVPASEPAAHTDDAATVDALIGAIYDGPLETPPWKAALELLRTALAAGHVTLMLRPPSSEGIGAAINTGSVPPAGVRTYATQFFAGDPFVDLPAGEVVTAEELIGREWLQSTIYVEYLEPLGIRHLLGADIVTRNGIECRLRVTRGKDAAGFSDDDKQLVAGLLPHLKRAIQIHARLDSLECERELFAGTLNRLQLGVVSIRQDGAVVDSNEEATRIFEERDGLWLSGGAISVDNSLESRELQKMIRRALASAADATQPRLPEAMSITRPSGRPKIGILVQAVPLGEWSESRDRPTVALYLRDPQANPVAPSQDIVRRLFGLTRMEAALALRLTEGLTLDEAAEALNVRRNTARTHLRSIFCKTGVTRQTMLVRLLLNSVVKLG